MLSLLLLSLLLLLLTQLLLHYPWNEGVNRQMLVDALFANPTSCNKTPDVIVLRGSPKSDSRKNFTGNLSDWEE